MGSTSAQGSVGNGLAGDNLSQHQARLQAAAAAASIYEKSYVYPSANTLVWYRVQSQIGQNGGEKNVAYRNQFWKKEEGFIKPIPIYLELRLS